jgi:hypothetical protein
MPSSRNRSHAFAGVPGAPEHPMAHANDVFPSFVFAEIRLSNLFFECVKNQWPALAIAAMTRPDSDSS